MAPGRSVSTSSRVAPCVLCDAARRRPRPELREGRSSPKVRLDSTRGHAVGHAAQGDQPEGD